ncbi:hypothetical protein ACT3CE_03400 [Marinifilum sp. RC60d5]|uniref:hypothetical protein n=1 Tax=Marinifilum sp. RC60d5 TaxID=3458414 RepID=UPI00403653AB
MNKAILIFSLIVTIISCNAQDKKEKTNKPSSEQKELRSRPKQMKDLDFFIGEWTTTNRSYNLDGSLKNETIGSIKAQTFDGGRVFLDETVTYTTDGEIKEDWITIRTFDPKTNKWVMSYITSLSSVHTQTFGGQFIDGEGHFDAVVRLNSETTMNGKVRFYDIRKNSFEWSMEISPDGGKTWVVIDRISATRVH